MEETKVCHKCKGTMDYDPYFCVYVCQDCGQIEGSSLLRTWWAKNKRREAQNGRT